MSFDDEFVDRNDSAVVDKELKECNKQVQRGKVSSAVGDFVKTIIFLIVLFILSIIIITISKPIGPAQAIGIFGNSIGFCLVPTIVAWPMGCLYIKALLKRQFITGIIPIAIFGPYLTTSLLVVLIDNASSLKTGFFVAFIVSPLSLFLSSKKVGTK